jgi:hypothetical protein
VRSNTCCSAGKPVPVCASAVGHSITASTCECLRHAGIGYQTPQGPDKHILRCCRVLGSSPGACSAYGYKQTHKETLQHTLLYDLAVNPLDSYVLTADQGGSMRMWDATNGSVLRSIQPEVGAGEWPGNLVTHHLPRL